MTIQIELTVKLQETDTFDAEIESFAAGIMEDMYDGQDFDLKVEYSNDVPHNNMRVWGVDGNMREAHLDTGWVDSIAR